MVSFPARPADDPESQKPDTPVHGAERQLEELASHLRAQGIQSKDLVLDLILHDLADEARAAVGAAGAAIALERDGELVCRAAAGSTAPDLGVRIHTDSGLSGICVQQRQTQICRDTECDDRVDAEACRRLGVRSIVVIPLFSDDTIIGIFEAFSPRANAYTSEHVETLERFALSAAQTVQTASQKSGPPERATPRSHPGSEMAPTLSVTSIMEKAAPIDPGVRVLRWLLIGLAIPLLILIGFDLGWHRMRSSSHGSAPGVEEPAAAEFQAKPALVTSGVSDVKPLAKNVVEKPRVRDELSSRGGLVISQNGRVIYREVPRVPATGQESQKSESNARKDALSDPVPPLPTEKAAAEGASVSLPAGIMGGHLIKSVRPQYPAGAIKDKREGSVVLHGTVGQDGVMENLQVVSGDPVLSEAALKAVEQWQYEPYRRNGKPVRMPIDITIDFRLPK